MSKHLLLSRYSRLHTRSLGDARHFYRQLINTPVEVEKTESQFLMAFDSNMAPIVGQQITLTATNGAVVGPRIDLLIARAAAGECDLVVKGYSNPRGFLYDRQGQLFLTDRASEAALTDAALRSQAAIPNRELTYTCAPPGSGRRIGIDADLDGYLDRDETGAGSDPRDPASVP